MGRLIAYLDRIASDAGKARAELLAAEPSKPAGKAGGATLANLVKHALSGGGHK